MAIFSRSPYLVWSLVIVCIGCKAEAPSAEPLAADSPASTGAVTVSAAPVTRLSEQVPLEMQPLEVQDATRLPDGRIAYVSGRDLQVRIASTAGRGVPASIGRDGEGPGEFKSLKWIERCGDDRLYTWDFLQDRLSTFSLTGEFLSQFTIAGPSLTRLYCDNAGMLMALETPREALGPPSGNFEPMTARILILDGTGKSMIEVKDVPMGRNRPLGTVTTGGFVGDNVMLGTAEEASIQLLQRDGALIREIPLGSVERTITPALYEAELDQIAAQTHENVRARVREALATVPMPPSLPAYRSIVTDKERVAWITLSSLGDGKTRLMAVDVSTASSSGVIGTLEFPFEAELLEAGSGYLLLRTPSDDGDDVLVFELTLGSAR
jgi:hypothetical protein